MSASWLRIEVAGLQPYQVALDRDLNTVGRATHNTIGLRDMNVSRQHFSIERRGESFFLVDSGSRNGTMVNGCLVREHELKQGDEVVVGSSTITYLVANESTPTARTGGHAGGDEFEGSNVLPPESQIGLGQGEPPLQGSDLFAFEAEAIAAARDLEEPPVARGSRRTSELLKVGDDARRIKNHRDRWRRLAEIAGIIGSELELSSLLDSVVEALLQLVPSRGAFLVLHHEGDFKLEVARNMEASQLADASGRLRLSTQICRQAVIENRPILTEDAAGDENLNRFLSVANLRIESVLAMPFGVQDEVLGLVYLDQPGLVNFSDSEDELLEIVAAFGGMAGMAVKNAQLLGSIRSQERIKQELRVAAKIQRSLLPRGAPVVPGLELWGQTQPAKEIGGDLYDFLVRPEPYNDLLIGIGDVSGKGIGAGLVGSSMRSLLHAFASVEGQTDQILIRANATLAPDLEPGIFVSFVLFRYQPTTGQLFYTGAGHEHLIIYRARTHRLEKVKSGGVVLGLSSDLRGRLEEKSLLLEDGDAIVLYSDGATEATDAAGEEFGINRVGSIVLQLGRQGCESIVKAIASQVSQFHGTENEQEDDLTLVAFRRTRSDDSPSALASLRQ